MGGPGYVNGVRYVEFDNFYEAPFELYGIRWLSSEQCYQGSKFTDEGYRQRIANETSGTKYYMMGHSREYPIIENFNATKRCLMYKANYAKFSQNPVLKNLLVSTGDSPIEYRSSTEYWNIENGKILAELRNLFRNIPL